MKRIAYFLFMVCFLVACKQKPETNPEPTPPSDLVGTLPGVFSVSPSTQVHFSKGNLQYNIHTEKWQFAKHQYTIIGLDNTTTPDGIKDLFSWYTNGWKTGTEWRLLTDEEWKYLVLERPNYNTLSRQASVNTQKGMIILPDDWNNGTLQNIYTSEEWEKLETQGAVFLPFAGLGVLESGAYTSVGIIGAYWSETSRNADNAWMLCLIYSATPQMASTNKYTPLAFRLVTDN